MSEFSDVDSGHESQGLHEAQQEFGQSGDASQSLEAVEAHHHLEFDEHLVHVHHVEYDDVQGNHFEETSYEVVDVHVEQTDDSYTVETSETDYTVREVELAHGYGSEAGHASGIDAAQSYGDISFLHDDLEQLLTHSSFEHGLDTQLAPGGSDADGVGGISEA